jgi:hypothetical protein
MTHAIDPKKQENLPTPTSQEPDKAREKRMNKPSFMRDFPKFFGKLETKSKFSMLDEARLENLLSQYSPEIQAQIREDIEVLKTNLLDFFREHDTEAKIQQNRHRKHQMIYVGLAFVATVIGGGQAIATGRSETALIILATLETFVALGATYVANLTGSESPMQKWIQSRRIAEFLRQEYFRYILRLDPYDHITDEGRLKLHLAQRAAQINKGNHPDIDPSTASGVQ